ncbi:hypothetical protein GCM10009735_02380 [Actinomadura chokoriensis]
MFREHKGAQELQEACDICVAAAQGGDRERPHTQFTDEPESGITGDRTSLREEWMGNPVGRHRMPA